MGLRYVYGTKTKAWHLVNESDRDFKFGLTADQMSKLGIKKAKKIYLGSTFIK